MHAVPRATSGGFRGGSSRRGHRLRAAVSRKLRRMPWGERPRRGGGNAPRSALSRPRGGRDEPAGGGKPPARDGGAPPPPGKRRGAEATAAPCEPPRQPP